MRTLIEYIGRQTVTQGRFAGERLRVLPWQRRFVNGAFAPGVATAGLSVARGNGKTTLVSALASATIDLDGPLANARGDTILVSGSFEQARIAFDHILAFGGSRFTNKDLFRVWNTAQQARIQNRATGAMVRCIGSDPNRAHGLAPKFILADEPAQWPANSGDRMVAALRTAAGKLPDCLFVAIGTRPEAEEHWFAKMLAGAADYAQCHAAAETDPPFRQSTWRKANPSLRYMPDLLAAIKREAADARIDGNALAAFRALRLNMGTSDTRREYLIGAAAWKASEGDQPRKGQPVFGVDLGSGASMSAVAACWPETGRLECVAAFPSEPGLAERGLADGVGRLYLNMADAGDLVTLGGRMVPIDALLHLAIHRFGMPLAVVCDRWREAELIDALTSLAAHVPIETRGQGFKDGGEDVRHFQRAILTRQVQPVTSLLLRSAMGEAVTVADPAGNRKIVKRRDRSRDDAAVAACLAGSYVNRVLSAPDAGPAWSSAAI